MNYGYSYGGYPNQYGYFAPPMPDQLAQLRQGAYQPPVMNNAPPQTQNPAQNAQQPNNNVISPQQPMQAMTGPFFVSGDAGARGYLVAPNNTVMLIDADPNSNTFWFKSADAAGMPTMRTFDYKERIDTPKGDEDKNEPMIEYVTKEEFDALAERASALENELIELKKKDVAVEKKPVVKESKTNGK